MIPEPGEKDWIDIHSHKGEYETGIFRIHNIFLQEFIENPERKKTISVGLHPWHINNYKNERGLTQELEKIIQNHQIIAIGEAGIDKVLKIDIEKQKEIFRKQIELSEKYQIPMIIHCVKANQELLRLRKDMDAQQAWIFHGFNSSVQLAWNMIEHGIFISVGLRLLKNPKKCENLLKNIPEDFIFVETDDDEKDIKEIYAMTAECMDKDTENLRKKILNNYKEVFSNE